MGTRRALMHFCNKLVGICHQEPEYHIPNRFLHVLFHQKRQLPI